MSQNRTSKKLSKAEMGSAKYQTIDLQSILTSMLDPIVQEISVLNETVSSVLSILSKKENECEKKLSKNCEFATSSIATDVTMMASSIHRLTKNYDSLKEQIVDNQKNLDKFWTKLNNIEKLLISFLKMENNRTMKNIEDQIFDKVSNLENALLGATDDKQMNGGNDLKQHQVSASVGLDSSLQLITLNNEEDYPNGSWLGDMRSAKCRVRCPISEEDVIYINTRCATPEKMAITLLDYLFPREILAVSNLSGKSKLGKKQLDPLMIYGIKCHLMHHFNISEKQWERIKQNMDSKCRSAWKKRKLNEPKDGQFDAEEPKSKQMKEDQKTIETIEQLMVGGLKTQVIHTLQGDIEVLHATPDQILRFQDVHNIQVLDGDHILPVINSDPDDSDNAIVLTNSDLDGKDDCEENLTIITTNDDLHSADEVSFVTEPMLEVLTEDTLNIDSSVLIEEG